MHVRSCCTIATAPTNNYNHIPEIMKQLSTFNTMYHNNISYFIHVRLNQSLSQCKSNAANVKPPPENQ